MKRFQGAVCFLLLSLWLQGAAFADDTAPLTAEIPQLYSERTEVIPMRDTQVTIRASVKNCAVYLNGEYQGNTVLTLSSLQPGLYHLRVEKKGYCAADYLIESFFARHEYYYVEMQPFSPDALPHSH